MTMATLTELSIKQSKYQYKLEKYQHKLSLLPTKYDNPLKILKKTFKYRYKIQKQLTKLALLKRQMVEHNSALITAKNIVQQPVTAVLSEPQQHKFYHLDAIDIKVAQTEIEAESCQQGQCNINRPCRAKPCKNCPALQGLACRCAIKRAQRMQ
ncbi:hypothetical protein [Shewanella marina]|uniref:hypothetical protein n=1 Tax=Shewanella marina TaxID=487319 RepID=UPI00046FC846|nr:hypothetical protein [Shewanella marina]